MNQPYIYIKKKNSKLHFPLITVVNSFLLFSIFIFVISWFCMTTSSISSLRSSGCLHPRVFIFAWFEVLGVFLVVGFFQMRSAAVRFCAVENQKGYYQTPTGGRMPVSNL